MAEGKERAGAESASEGPRPTKEHFFISYTATDQPWAAWLARQLEDAGYTTIYQARDFRPGFGFVTQVDQALIQAERMIAVLSPDYLASDWAQAEWNAKVAEDPRGLTDKLLVVRVAPLEVEGLLKGRTYVDLVGLDEALARERLLGAVREGPISLPAPVFPVAAPHPAAPAPEFPGWPSVINDVPHRNPNFIGREEALAELGEAVDASAGKGLAQALHGLGGVGKSQIAAEYFYRHAADYDLVWWIRAHLPATIASAFADLASRIDDRERPGASPERLLEVVKENLSRRDRWLLVFDFAEKAEDLEPYRPQGGRGHILITSQNPVWGGVAHSQEVPLLSPDEALAFLRRRVKGSVAEAGGAEANMVADLAKELGYLPLALEQAAAYIEQTAMPLGRYLRLFRESRDELLARGEPTAYEGRLDTTWQLAFDRVAERSPAAVELLRVIAFLAYEAIPLSLLSAAPEALPDQLRATVQNEIRLEDAVGALYAYSLVGRDADMLRVHRLVQAVVRSHLPTAECNQWLGRALRLLAAAFPPDGHRPDTWARCKELVAHVIVATGHAEDQGVELPVAAELLKRAGVYLASHVRLPAAEEVLSRALSIAEGSIGRDQPEVAEILGIQGAVLRELGRQAEARASLERALDIEREAFGPTSPRVARTMARLGIVLRRDGKLPEARRVLESSLEIQEAGPAGDEMRLATVLTDLGVVLWDTGHLAEARAHFQRALDLVGQRHPPDHAAMATPLTFLGGVLRDLGDLEGARTNLARALAIDSATYEPNHPRVAARLNNLGTVLRRLGDLAGARDHLERALAIDEPAYGPDHFEVATVCNNLGIVLRRQGELAAARASLERALEIDQRGFGQDHPRVATRCTNLADVQRDLGDLAAAEAGYRRALSISEATYGPDHRELDTIRRKLAGLNRLPRRPRGHPQMEIGAG